MVNEYLRILSVDDPVDAVKLARKAKRVRNVQSTECILGIQRMKRAATKWEHETGRKCEGLAAPQIGWNKRVIILRASDDMEPKDPRTFTKEDFLAKFKITFDDVGHAQVEHPDDWSKYIEAVDAYIEWKRCYGNMFDPWMVLINPTVKQAEGELMEVEGCLSVPHGGYEMTRPTHVAFKFTRPNRTYSGVHLAKSVTRPDGTKDRSAQVLMHEVGHLNGDTINLHGSPIVGSGSERL